jgi:hypothetical protein
MMKKGAAQYCPQPQLPPQKRGLMITCFNRVGKRETPPGKCNYAAFAFRYSPCLCICISVMGATLVVVAFAFGLFDWRSGCLHLHSVIALTGPGGRICISLLSNAENAKLHLCRSLHGWLEERPNRQILPRRGLRP